MRVQPTTARLVTPAAASQVVVPTLDSLTSADRVRIRESNPTSYLHALHEPADLEAETMRSAAATSAQGLRTLLDAGVFADEPAGMYAYRTGGVEPAQISIIATVPVEQFDSVIVPHEKTRPARVAYLAHYRATVGHVSSPVAVAYPPSAELDGILQRATATRPLLDFITEDGDPQTVWRIDEVEATIAAFSGVPRAYVSDGHHRVAAARTVSDVEDGLVLTALTSTTVVQVLPFHRVVDGLEVRDLLAGLEDVSTLSDRSADGPPVGSVWVGASGRWWSGRLPGDVDAQVPDSMDAARLHRRVLSPLGVRQDDQRLQYVPGLTGLDELTAVYPDDIVIAMAPAVFSDVVTAAEAGRTLPLKSTYIRPKPHSGIFLAPT